MKLKSMGFVMLLASLVLGYHSPAEGLSAAHRLADRLDDPWLLGLFGE